MDVRTAAARTHVVLFPTVSGLLRRHRPGAATAVAVLGPGAGLAMAIDTVRARRLGLLAPAAALVEGATAARRATAR